MPGISETTSNASTPAADATAAAANIADAGSADDSAANNADDDAAKPIVDDDKYVPPAGIRELTQTDRLNKQLLESLLNRMHAAAQASSSADSGDQSDREDTTTTPRNSIDWE